MRNTGPGSKLDRRFVRIAEGLVHLREGGRSDASARPPVVLLHASPSSSRSLAPLMAELARRRHVLAPDTLGNGDSPPPAVPEPEVADFADAMDRTCTALGLDRLDVYGTHTGAHIAIEWAIARPERVRRVVLDGVAVMPPELRAEFLERYAPTRSPSPTGDQFHWAWQFIRDQMIFFPYYRRDAEHLRAGGTFDPVVLHELTLDVLRSLETYHLPYRAVFRHDVLERLQHVGQPVLCISGEQDPLDPNVAAVLDALPGGREARVHRPDGPAGVAAAMLEFLDQAGD